MQLFLLQQPDPQDSKAQNETAEQPPQQSAFGKKGERIEGLDIVTDKKLHAPKIASYF
jgi:hypothetical protein